MLMADQCEKLAKRYITQKHLQQGLKTVRLRERERQRERLLTTVLHAEFQMSNA